MIQGSAALEEALRSGHQPSVTAEVWQSNRRVGPLEVSDGRVTQSGSQFQRRSGSVTVRPTTEALEWLAQPGACVRVWRGVQGLGKGIPVLWGPARAPKRSLWSAELEVSVEDLSRRVLRDKFPSPRQTTPGTTIAAQILLLWRESVPWCGWDDDTMDATAVPAITWDSDRAQAITDLSASIGCESWMRPDGTVMLRRLTSLLTRTVHTVQQRVNLSSQALSHDWDATFNHVVVRSDSTDSRVTGQWADFDSPTGITQCGRNLLAVSSAAVTTDAQAKVMAQTLVLRSQGARVSGEWTSVLHPGVEVGDVHQVTSDLGQHRFVLDGVSWDLHGAGMDVQGRIPSIADGLEEGVA